MYSKAIYSEFWQISNSKLYFWINAREINKKINIQTIRTSQTLGPTSLSWPSLYYYIYSLSTYCILHIKGNLNKRQKFANNSDANFDTPAYSHQGRRKFLNKLGKFWKQSRRGFKNGPKIKWWWPGTHLKSEVPVHWVQCDMATTGIVIGQMCTRQELNFRGKWRRSERNKSATLAAHVYIAGEKGLGIST